MKDYLFLKEQNQKPFELNKKESLKTEVKEKILEENIEKSFPKAKDEDFSFDSDLSSSKPEPLKEFWD